VFISLCALVILAAKLPTISYVYIVLQHTQASAPSSVVEIAYNNLLIFLMTGRDLLRDVHRAQDLLDTGLGKAFNH
jgi:hypothetical protein